MYLVLIRLPIFSPHCITWGTCYIDNSLTREIFTRPMYDYLHLQISDC